jgi:hypothetical protein
MVLAQKKSPTKRRQMALPYIVVLRYVPAHARRRKRERVPYIEARAMRISGLRYDVALQNKYVNARGAEVRYTVADLRYDLDAGVLRESREFDVRNAEWLTEDTAFAMSEPAIQRAVRSRTAHLTRRRKDGKPSKARVLSSCAPAAYRNRHPLTSMRACPADERCRYLGPGKGHHCVTRKRAVVPAIAVPDTGYDREETGDLSAFMCARLGLR